MRSERVGGAIWIGLHDNAHVDNPCLLLKSLTEPELCLDGTLADVAISNVVTHSSAQLTTNLLPNPTDSYNNRTMSDRNQSSDIAVKPSQLL